jgi:hypothetical protein
MVVMGEKLGGEPHIGHPACCGLRRESFFSGAMDLLNSVDDYAKGCHVQLVMIVHVVWIRFLLQDVYRFKSL